MMFHMRKPGVKQGKSYNTESAEAPQDTEKIRSRISGGANEVRFR